ncbi:HSF-type DNA-binding protein [Nitzschia inconspicua]|uniref:HSF-type DNA-binding protein n=1 Tax=Nitzschia inconspicua TaxID=303405 RepID=A0A9K3LVI3_9STRA|nr:HSF-type DNA-binding protein [Nitzschia inconspicua]
MDELRIKDASPDLSFPLRLYLMLRDADEEFPSAIQWVSSSNGRIFEVKDPEELEKNVLPVYFKSSIKYSSFRRQLLGYGFESIGKRQYTHKIFCRHDPKACEQVERIKTKPKKNKAVNRFLLTSTVQPLASHEQGVDPVLIPLEPLGKHHHQRHDSEDIEPIGVYNDKGEMDSNEEDLFMNVLRLFPISSNPNPPTRISPATLVQDDQPVSKEQNASPQHSPVKALWSSYAARMDNQLEPRRIQEMLAAPNPWYSFTPSMTPEQQAIVELFSPITLPGAFYYLEMNQLAFAISTFVIVIHTFLCFYTNFYNWTWYKSAVGPLQHIGWDMLLNHLMNSTFLLLGPSVFGAYCIPVALGMILANSIAQAINYKCHFEAFILTPILATGNVSTKVSKLARVLQYKLGRHVRRAMQFYFCAWLFLAISLFLAKDGFTPILAVFVYNLSPFVSDMSYWLEFSKQLLFLPERNRTFLCDRHLRIFISTEAKSCQ